MRAQQDHNAKDADTEREQKTGHFKYCLFDMHTLFPRTSELAGFPKTNAMTGLTLLGASLRLRTFDHHLIRYGIFSIIESQCIANLWRDFSARLYSTDEQKQHDELILARPLTIHCLIKVFSTSETLKNHFIHFINACCLDDKPDKDAAFNEIGLPDFLAPFFRKTNDTINERYLNFLQDLYTEWNMIYPDGIRERYTCFKEFLLSLPDAGQLAAFKKNINKDQAYYMWSLFHTSPLPGHLAIACDIDNSSEDMYPGLESTYLNETLNKINWRGISTVWITDQEKANIFNNIETQFQATLYHTASESMAAEANNQQEELSLPPIRR